MSTNLASHAQVAVIGAGPAGLFAARQLALDGVRVALINRDVKPGGLAEYGIYPDKHKMKEGLRNQFHQILANPLVEYYGNLVVGETGDVRLEDLRACGFQAILVTVGAQGTKWLGLPGEDLRGVYHAKDLVYHYNHLPPFSQNVFDIGRRVAVVGAGNVSIDISHYLICERQVDEIIIVARRGPNEAKYEKKELEAVVANLDRDAYLAELGRAAPVVQALGQDPLASLALMEAARLRAEPCDAATRLTVRFLSSPLRIQGDGQGRVCGLEVEENELYLAGDEVKARGTGVLRVLDVDTVIFAIGDRVDPEFGLPVSGNTFRICPEPAYPVEGISYEAYDPETGCSVKGIFLAGWSRQASTGLVGVARKDGTNGAKAVLEYLRGQPPLPGDPIHALKERLASSGKSVVIAEDIRRLEAVERDEAARLGLEEFKYGRNEEMLAAISRLRE